MGKILHNTSNSQNDLNYMIERVTNSMHLSRVEFINLLICVVKELEKIYKKDGVKGKLLTLKLSNLLISQYEYRNGYVKLMSKPFFLQLDPADGCPLSCPGCIHSPTMASKVNSSNALMTKNIFTQIMNLYGSYAMGMYFYHYGEPFLNKNVYDMISYARGFGVQISISSNLCVPIDAEALVRSGLSNLICSIDGATQEVYEKYRRGGNLKQVEKNMRAIAEAKKRLGIATPNIVWQFLAFEHNVHEVELARTLAEKWGANQFMVANPFSVQYDDPNIKELKTDYAGWYDFSSFDWEGFVKNGNEAWDNLNETQICIQYEVFKKNLENISDDFKEEKTVRYCDWPYQTVVIDASGRLFPCCYMQFKSDNGKEIMGKVTGFDDTNKIYNSTEYQDLRKNPKRLSPCELCTGRTNTAFSLEHISRDMQQLQVYEFLSKESIKNMTDWTKNCFVLNETCFCCSKESDFFIQQGATLLREAICEHCGASLRNSDVMHVLKKTSFCGQPFDKCKDELIILNTSSYGGVHKALEKLSNYVYSEFYPNVPSGERAENGVLCVDLLNIPFDDESLDVIISEDVLEHIEDYMAVFNEIKRVLKPGGVHIFTVPIREDGKTMFRKNMPNIYHDAPDGTGGALLYNDFSFDLCQMYSDNDIKTTCELLHKFYEPEVVNHLENEYDEYLLKKDRPLEFYRLNSWVFVSKKTESTEYRGCAMEFTGERFIPGQTDLELEMEHVNRYQFARQFVRDKIVLDAACGEGYGSDILARDAKIVYGVDISEESIIHAKNKYDYDKVSFNTSSVCELPFEDDKFDVVVSFETLEHIDEPSQMKFMNEIRRVLKNNGILVMSTPNHKIYKQRGENHFHIKELEYKEFIDLLEKHFAYVSVLGQQFEIANTIVSTKHRQSFIESSFKDDEMEYFIAVCSNSEISPIYTRSIVRGDQKLRSLMDWAISNHEMNERNNEYIANVNKQLETLKEHMLEKDAEYKKLAAEKDAAYNQLVAEKDAAYNQLSAEKDTEYNQLVAEKDAAYNQLSAEKDAIYNQLVEQNNSQIASLEQTIRNKEGHIALLLESDRELERIKTSRSWRFMGYAWKLRDVVVPKNSKRRLIGKMAIKFVKHPIRFIGKCTPTRISKFFYTLKREGVEGTSRKMDDCLVGTDIQKTEIEIVSISQDEIKKISDYSMISVPQWDMPQVSIIIPVYNQFDYTYHCIQSILKNSGDITYEIIIADDCSTDITKEIEKAICGIQVIRNTENLRFLKNCNNAAKYAKGEYILFLNNDTQVQENWIAPLIELIERDKTIGMVGSKLVYPDGRLQEAGGILWKDGSAWNYGNRSDPDLPEFNYVKDVDYISGASIMISSKLWNEIGGFDERFAPAYCEDSDLAFEVRKHGYRVVYQPLSVVVHFEGVSNGTDTSSGQKAYQVVNAKKFYEKWKDILEREHNANGVCSFLAREKGIDKKVLLMVDHYVPQFDKDAGSRTVFQYINLFVSQGYHVKFIGDNFYPHQPYTQALQQIGVEVLYGEYYSKHWKEWLQENGQYIRYVFLNRPHISVKYIDEIRKYTNAKVIYYGHDLHFLREIREYELTGDETCLKSSQDWKEKELSLMRKADIAYYPSYVEVEEIAKIAPDVNAKAIPAYIFDNIQPINYSENLRKDIMFVGGFGHRPNIDAVLWFVNEIMPKLQKLLPDVKLHVIGSKPTEEIKKLDGGNIHVTGFVTDEELAGYYSECRLAVVPLRYGAGIKGKVVEAMKWGMPVVTTSVGAEGIIDAKDILEIHDNADDFANYTAKLYQDEEKRKKLSEKSIEYIKSHFSPNNAKQTIGDDFDM